MIEHQKMPLVYIIILTWNQWDMTLECLTSILQVTYPNYKVVVVDNGSTDGTVESIKKHFPQVEVIVNSSNLGFAAGSNVGIKYALDKKADYVLLLNNDTLVAPDCIDNLVVQAYTLPDAGILTPKIVYAGKNAQIWSAGSRCHPLTLDAMSVSQCRSHKLQDCEPRLVDYIFGTAMLIRREVVERIGLFDESFFMYYEDMDFCLRARAAGYKLYYVPTAIVQHYVAASTRNLIPVRYYHKAYSSVLFFRKHTQGMRWLIVIPYRLSSAICTVLRLIRQGQLNAIRAYLQGLVNGLKKRRTLC